MHYLVSSEGQIMQIQEKVLDVEGMTCKPAEPPFHDGDKVYFDGDEVRPRPDPIEIPETSVASYGIDLSGIDPASKVVIVSPDGLQSDVTDFSVPFVITGVGNHTVVIDVPFPGISTFKRIEIQG